MNRRTCIFTGRVQGVGFRYTAQSIAHRHPVCGYVRNCPDGSVEMVMEAADSAMDAVLDELKSQMSEHIRHVEIVPGKPTGEFKGFSIR